MTSFVYGIVREEYSLSDTRRVSYGIVCYADPETDGTATIIASARDISSDFDSVSRLVDLCNRHILSPLHLRDVVDDFFK